MPRHISDTFSPLFSHSPIVHTVSSLSRPSASDGCSGVFIAQFYIFRPMAEPAATASGISRGSLQSPTAYASATMPFTFSKRSIFGWNRHGGHDVVGLLSSLASLPY